MPPPRPPPAGGEAPAAPQHVQLSMPAGGEDDSPKYDGCGLTDSGGSGGTPGGSLDARHGEEAHVVPEERVLGCDEDHQPGCCGYEWPLLRLWRYPLRHPEGFMVLWMLAAMLVAIIAMGATGGAPSPQAVCD